MPKYAIAHSGRFSDIKSTRSPGFTPAACRVRPARSEKRASSSYVTRSSRVRASSAALSSPA